MPSTVHYSDAIAQQRVDGRRSLLSIAATVVAWFAMTVENGAQQLQTDWAVSGVAPIASVPTPADLRQQMILDNIFFVHAPLLHKRPAPPAPPEEPDPNTSWLRFAVRSDGVEGWRPASQHADPRGTAQHPPLSRLIPLDSLAPPQAPGAQDPATTSPTDDLVAPPVPVPPGATEPVGAGDGEEKADLVPAETVIEDAPSDAKTEAPSVETKRGVQNHTSNDTLPIEIPKASTPAKPLPPLSRQLMTLRSRVRSVLRGYYRKTLNSREHDPWEVMHGMLAYGVQSRIRQGGSRGELITSVGWLCYNKPCKGQTLMHVTRGGELRAKYGVGLQGHLGQLLAMLAQCRVAADYPIRVGKNQFTIHDLIESEKKTCYPKSELTFKLLAFQYYLDLNDKWVNDRGEEWDFPRLIREELAQPIRGAACGGTHRLSSLSLTVKARERRGEPLDGEYARAAEFVHKYHQYAFRLQNRDGSLSTSWFRGRGDESDIDRRIKTTGHILEWLCYSLSDEELRDPRTIRAVSYLANLMYSNYDNEWEVGPMCHATHALLLYDERVFEPYDRPGYAVSYKPRPSTAMRYQRNAIRR